MNVGSLVYALCALTSLLCAVLLARSLSRSRSRLLVWSCACFAILALNNGLLFVDLAIVPDVDLSAPRASMVLIAFLLLLYGLVWESK